MVTIERNYIMALLCSALVVISYGLPTSDVRGKRETDLSRYNLEMWNANHGRFSLDLLKTETEHLKLLLFTNRHFEEFKIKFGSTDTAFKALRQDVTNSKSDVSANLATLQNNMDTKNIANEEKHKALYGSLVILEKSIEQNKHDVVNAVKEIQDRITKVEQGTNEKLKQQEMSILDKVQVVLGAHKYLIEHGHGSLITPIDFGGGDGQQGTLTE